MKNKQLLNIVLSALFIAIGIVLPFITGQIPRVGKMLLPMHIPVFLCALICSKGYGAAVGLILPIFRSLLFSAPVLYPSALVMAPELCAYGFFAGLLYEKFKDKGLKGVYMSIIPAMLAGRLVWGVFSAIVLGVTDEPFTFAAFITGGFVNGAAGIAAQLVIIPTVIKAVNSLTG